VSNEEKLMKPEPEGTTGFRKSWMAPFLAALTVLVLVPALVFGDVGYPTAGPEWAIDDSNTSGVLRISSILSSDLGYYSWVTQALAGATGSGGYTSNWVQNDATLDAVSNAIADPVYEAWVCSEPTDLTVPNGPPIDRVSSKLTPFGNFTDVGGAAIVLTYTPNPSIPIQNPDWIQVYHGSQGGALEQPTVDSPTPPFYVNGAKGTPGNGKLTSDGKMWLVDRPFTIEPETEPDPVANEEFASLLVGSNPVTKQVTIYGGVDWGYTYTAEDQPVITQPLSVPITAPPTTYGNKVGAVTNTGGDLPVTPAVATAYVQITGTQNNDENIAAFDVLVNGVEATDPQIQTLIDAIEGTDGNVLASTDVAAASYTWAGLAPTVTGPNPFDGTVSPFNLYVDLGNAVDQGTGPATFLGWDLSSDPNLAGYSIEEVAVVPEPMSLGLLALGGLGLMNRRYRKA
jgi:hypothetical protein